MLVSSNPCTDLCLFNVGNAAGTLAQHSTDTGSKLSRRGVAGSWLLMNPQRACFVIPDFQWILNEQTYHPVILSMDDNEGS